MRKLVLIILILICGVSTKAQHHEFGPFFGASYYIGDLNKSGHFSMASPAFGLMYRYALNQRWALKVNGYYGKLQGDDAITNQGDKERKARNLSFLSPILDFSGQVEFNFFEFVAGSDNHRFTPFLFSGLSVFRFNPQAEFDGEWHELQPLGTEGQNTTAYPDRSPYNLTSIAIPFGIGFKWNIAPSVTLNFEWGLRKTFTDYIDDVSTTYADPAILAAENQPYALVLGNRMFELTDPSFPNNGWGPAYGGFGPGGEPMSFPLYPRDAASLFTGKQRGNSQNNDWYGIAGLAITFKLVGPRAKTCPAYKKHFNYKEYYNY